ncbi:MAG TPA: TonB-dependent receptor [Thermoanaerobaculia bacterium]
MRKLFRGPLGLALFLFWIFAPALALAFEGRLLLPDGTPAAGYEVSVVGRSLSVTTDGQGRFVISPDPTLPFQLVASGPAGEVSPVIDILTLPEGVVEVAMPAAFRDSVTVTSGVAPGLEAPPAAATTLVGQQDLEQRRPQRLVEVLEAVPGTSNSGEGPTSVPSIRGLARGRTLILLDGARVVTERRAGASAGFLDPFTLASIEVARGPGSVAYGSDALGGVINARPRYPEPGESWVRYTLNKGFGGDDEESAGVEASGSLLGGGLLGQFHIRRAGEAEAAGGEPIDNSSYRDRGGALRYTVDTPAGRLKAGFSLTDSRDTGNPAVDSNVTRSIYPVEESRRFNLSLVTGPRGGWESVDLGLFLGTYQLVLDRDRLPTASVTRQIETSDTDARDGSIRAVGSRPLLGGRLQVGAEIVSRFGVEAVTTRQLFNLAGERTAVERTLSIEDAQRTNGGLFLSYDRPVLSDTLVSIGLRGDRVEAENRGGFFGDRSTSHQALSGYVAVTSSLASNLTGSLQVARGFRDPTLSDRYFRGPSGRGFVIGNPDLDPETSLQYDGSLRWAVGGGSIALFGYLYQIEDLIERFRPASDFLFRNRGEAEIRGAELELQQPLPLNLGLEVALTWSEGEAEDGSPLNDIPATGSVTTLRWASERGFAYLRNVAFLEDDEPGPTEHARPGYTTWDLGAGWHVFRNLELRVIGKNLADRRYRESADEVAALALGRTYTVGVVGRY